MSTSPSDLESVSFLPRPIQQPVAALWGQRRRCTRSRGCMVASLVFLALALLLFSRERPRPPEVADNVLDTWSYTPVWRRASHLDSAIFERVEALDCNSCMDPKDRPVNYPVYVGPPPPVHRFEHIRDITRGPFAKLDHPWILRVRDRDLVVDGNGRLNKGPTQWVFPGPCESALGADDTWWMLRAYDWLVRPTFKKAVVLTQRWSSHYYHFLLESLPRLALLPLEMLKDPNQLFIIQTLKYPSQQMEIVRWLGLESRLRVIEGEHWTAAITEELVVPQPCSCGACNPRVLLAFRKLLFTHTWLRELEGWEEPHENPPLNPDGTEPPPNPPRHVLWMQRLGDRGVSNDAGLFAIAKRTWPNAQFHVHTSAMSLADTARLFHLCDTLIGPHGAGWSNLIFARPGFRSIEFVPERYSNEMYVQIALIFGGRKHNFITAPAATKDTVMHIPVHLFEEALKL